MRFTATGDPKRILVYRDRGGLGDIFMHRMLFADLKQTGKHLTFACPKQYHDAVIDHPFIDNVIDTNINPADYGVIHDTSWACNRYEMKAAPYIEQHRSDIWAEQCRLTLSSHQMHFKLSPEELTWARQMLPEKAVALVPFSAMQGKNLNQEQINIAVEALHGCNVFLLHQEAVDVGVPHIPTTIRQMMAIIHECEAVVSVDTAALHCAGGMNKPLVGIFSFVDGKVYGKYYDMVLVQKHRDHTEGWTCGPCYNFALCPKETSVWKPRKPCIDMKDEIAIGIAKMRERFNI